MYKDLNDLGEVVINEEAFKNYIKNILITPVGSVPSNRAFGSYLEKYLFEPYDFRTKKLINMEIKRAISRWLKNVEIINIENQMDVANGVLGVVVELRAKGIPSVTVNVEIPIKG